MAENDQFRATNASLDSNAKDKDLRREFNQKLMQAKRNLENQLREEFSKEFQEVKATIEEERAELNRQKCELNVKSQQYKEAISSLIKETRLRERAYLETIDSLNEALKAAEKKKEQNDQNPILNYLAVHKEGSNTIQTDNIQYQLLNTNQGNPREESSAFSGLNSQKLRELEYNVGAKAIKEESISENQRKSHEYLRNCDFANDQGRNLREVLIQRPDSSARNNLESDDESDVSFEIRPSNDCSIYAQSCIERELRLLRQKYVQRGDQLPRSLKNPEPIVDEEFSDKDKVTDILQYSNTNRNVLLQEAPNLMTSASERENQKNQSAVPAKRLNKVDFTKEELSYDAVDEALRCKGLLDLILLLQPLDDQKTKLMKSIKLRSCEAFLRDDFLVPRVQAMRIILKNKYETGSSILKEYNSYFDRLLIIWETLANDLFLSNKEKLDILTEIDNQADVYESIKLTKSCVEDLRTKKTKKAPLLKLIQKRQKLRIQLEVYSQEFASITSLQNFNKSTSSIYLLLRQTNKAILSFLQKHSPLVGEQQPDIRGQPIIEQISLDFWEEEYLRKLQGRLKAFSTHRH